jgi:hypothetical protein
LNLNKRSRRKLEPGVSAEREKQRRERSREEAEKSQGEAREEDCDVSGVCLEY